MNEQHELERILAELLELIDNGADPESCLARYPQYAEALRPHLELNARLMSQELPVPAFASYEAGREAMLAELATAGVAGPAGRTALMGWKKLWHAVAPLPSGWGRITSPVARMVAVVVGIVVLTGGALGASAAVGFKPSRQVLSTVGMMQDKTGSDAAHVEKDEGSKPDSEHDKPGETPAGEPTEGATDDEHAVAPPPDGAEGDITKPAPDDGSQEEDGDTVPVKPPDIATAVPTHPIDIEPTAVPTTPVSVNTACVPHRALELFPKLRQGGFRPCTEEEFKAIIAPLGERLCLPADSPDKYLVLRGIVPVCTNQQQFALTYYLFEKGKCIPEQFLRAMPALSEYGVPACTPEVMAKLVVDILGLADCLALLGSLTLEVCPAPQEALSSLE
jgi:hypothetical protein